MKDVQLYQQILGDTRPWRVENVVLNAEAQEIEISMALDPQVWACPECKGRMHVHGYERRRWRHLDSCQFKTFLMADVPRVKCDTHGTQQVAVPWASKHGRFTALFERLAIDLMLECSVSAACDALRISWDEADGIKQRAVRRGLERKGARPMRRLCVDEKAVGWGHDYMTIVTVADGPQPTVEYLGDGRQRESLNAFWLSLSPEQRSQVEAVSMDMWKPFVDSTCAHVPQADIVHDSFHLTRYVNRALDEVRRSEYAALSARGDERLKGSRQLWLWGFENLPKRWSKRFTELRTCALRTARAWAIKEVFRAFWKCVDLADATAYLKRWCSLASKSRMEPLRRVARLFRDHAARILTYFKHRFNNAIAEGVNRRIQDLIQKSCGYRNRERFKVDVLFHLGGLNLYPASAQ